MKVEIFESTSIYGIKTKFDKWIEEFKLTQFQKLTIHHITQSQSQHNGCSAAINMCVFYTIENVRL